MKTKQETKAKPELELTEQQIADFTKLAEYQKDADTNGKERKLVCIILNLADYTVGATKGGEVSLFDDFDLNYNKYEYLIETRMSGALTMPKSAIAIEIQTTTDASADPVYTLVTSPATADIEDYFEQDEYGRYFATEDEAVVAGKKYYIAG